MFTDATKARSLAKAIRTEEDARKKLINADLEALTDTEALGLADEFHEAVEAINELLDGLNATATKPLRDNPYLDENRPKPLN